MSFISWPYVIFFVIVFCVYWCIPFKRRWIVLLISSYFYYMSWGIKYVFYLIFSTMTSYICARMIERRQLNGKRWVAFCVVLNIGLLFTLKYTNWFMGSLQYALNNIGVYTSRSTFEIIVPVGISFYTFQTIGYVVDVYKGKIGAEKNLGIYATFVSFFPHLLSGPISRGDVLMPQIKQGHSFDYDQATHGLKLIAIGLFKKMIIADILVQYVDAVFDGITEYTGFALVIAAFMFSIEIYCDFSGYSDIAIGTAQLLGIDLLDNFKSPYFSTSIKEFWGRWHISLSTWFRDYVYIPLGGNRCSKLRNNINLVITFLVSGLWHGASWTYVAWGGVHGLAQCIEKSFCKKTKNSKVTNMCAVIAVFVFTTLAWVFFRANSINEAFYLYAHAFSGIGNIVSYIVNGLKALNGVISSGDLIGVSIALIVVFVYDYFSRDTDALALIKRKRKEVKWSLYVAFAVLFILLMPASSDNTFIYFQF